MSFKSKKLKPINTKKEQKFYLLLLNSTEQLLKYYCLVSCNFPSFLVVQNTKYIVRQVGQTLSVESQKCSFKDEKSW